MGKNGAMRQAVVLLGALVLVAGCGSKKSEQALENMPDVDCICVMPAWLASSEPELNDRDREAITSLVQDEVESAISEVVPDHVTVLSLPDESLPDECDASLSTRIVFLELVEMEDTARSAAATAAGVALMAVTGIGFVTVPTARMSVSFTLIDSWEGVEIWSVTEQVSAPSVSVRENYVGQVKIMTGPLKTRLKNKFPIRKAGS